MKLFRHILPVILSVFLVASCVMDEMFSGPDQNEGKEVVMTFRPKFEDFRTVTKAIGDGTKVDRLMVQVYADGANDPEWCEEYDKDKWSKITIPFLYGKTYKVYFWAYCSTNNPYTIAENGLQDGVTVQYPQSDVLGFDALEHLDAFFAVETINLSDNIPDNTRPSLTRPFAQVNLVADKTELQTAKATKVVFTIKNVANQFKAGSSETSSTSDRTFVFESQDNFKDNQIFDGNNVYLGTTYLFVPSSGSLEAEVTLYDQMGNKLKGPSTVAIPLASNRRTNLVFSGVEPAWNNNAVIVPDEESDGWIHISTPEQLAALLISDRTDAKVHICNDIDMGGMPSGMQVGKSYTNLTLYGGGLDAGNQTGEGSVTIKNFTAPAFLGTATNLAVSNLALDNVNVTSADGHVGTLVNTLKGTSTFTNVTVSNSSATTTNGAAGGIVGYIERIAPTTRSEALNVTFENCHVNGAAGVPVATGSDAEGKFVGLLNGYDYGETLAFDDKCSADANTAVADYVSSYTAQNQSCFLTATDSKYDQYLGSEKNRRGIVNYGAQRIVPKWDGTKPTNDLIVESNSKLVFSPFDLALLQEDADPNTPLVTHSSVTFMNNVDMASRVFVPITKITNLYGNNYTIYNLKVDTMQDEGNSYGGAFMRNTGGGEHKDLTFDNADIKVVHNPNGSTGNAYGGILSASVSSTHTISNVHVKNSKLYAVCKMGGLVGRVHGGTFTCTGCSVDNCVLENYNAKDDDVFDISKEVSGVTATAYAVFGTSGEAGGLIGFLCTTANISDCAVTNTTMNCFGQRDQEIKLTAKVSGINGAGYFLVAGRHVNEFIGDIRTIYGENISISGCSIEGNKYGAKSSQGDATHPSNLHNCHFYNASRSCEKQKSANSGGIRPDYDYWFKYDVKNYTPFVGCVYYVGVDFGSIHIADSRGKVTIDNLVLDSIDEFVGGDLNNILDVGIAPLWGNLKNLKTEIVLSGSYK